MRERDLQQLIIDYLEKVAGCTVLQAGAWRRQTRCPACGSAFHAAGGHNTPGLPDILVLPKMWTSGERAACALLLELKTPSGVVRPAQQALADAGHSAIVRSLDDLRRVLIEHGIPVSIGAP